jgi:hypothetical protein
MWNAPAICRLSGSLLPHHVLEEGKLALVDEEHQFARPV